MLVSCFINVATRFETNALSDLIFSYYIECLVNLVIRATKCVPT